MTEASKHEHPCPSCGYCPTCGRRPTQQWPAPYQPWMNPWPWQRYPYTVTWNQASGTNQISASHSVGPNPYASVAA